MRCVLRPISVRSALPIVLMLAVAPTAAFAQSLVCHAIRRGESATQAARRVTGDSRNAYQAWFQIMNASSRFVPKSQYNRIRAGWRACVIKPATSRHVFERAARRHSRRAPRPQTRPKRSRLPDARGARALASADVVEVAGDRPQSAASDVLARSAVSISRWCGLAPRWLCRGSGGGSSTTISLAGRRRRSSCGISPIDSSVSSNGHWFSTTRRSVPCDRGSAAARDGGDSTFFSRRARAGAIRTCRTTRRTSNTTSPECCTCSPMTPS